MPARRKARLDERLQPCQCCLHPISQRHHLFEVAVWGGNEQTVPLCANCHELYHVIIYAGQGGERARKVLAHVEKTWGRDDPRLRFLRLLHDAAAAAQEQMEKLSDDTFRLQVAHEYELDEAMLDRYEARAQMPEQRAIAAGLRRAMPHQPPDEWREQFVLVTKHENEQELIEILADRDLQDVEEVTMIVFEYGLMWRMEARYDD